MKYNFQNYPRIFEKRFLSFSKILGKLKEDQTDIMLFVVVISNGTDEEKIEYLLKIFEEYERVKTGTAQVNQELISK